MGFSVPTISLTIPNAKLAPIILRPNGVGGKDELTPSAGAGWECVDESVSDDDTSYVYTDSIITKSSLFGIEATTATGTITSVRVISDAKSDTYLQSGLGIYKLLYSIDGGITTYESIDMNLTSSYANISYTWAYELSGPTSWTWTDIANLQIGVECSSPSISAQTSELILRPTSDYNRFWTCKMPSYLYTTLFEAIDDITSDDDTTYIMPMNNMLTSSLLCDIQNHTVESGPINSVTIYYRAKMLDYDPIGVWGYYDSMRSYISNGITTISGVEQSLSNTWSLYSETYILSPFTGISWTWAEIDSLKMGVYIKWHNPYKEAGYQPRCTQVYAVVNHTTLMCSPEIRTTQCYVELRTTETTKCYLPKPVDLEVVQNIDTNALNFWSGDREVYGLGRSSKRLMLSGLLWDGCTDGTSTCEDIIHCVRDMGKLKQPMNIAGLRYALLNNDTVTGLPLDYNIISFGWKQILEKPNQYEWQLELENCK